MIRVEESIGNDLPRSSPRKILVVDEDPHEFWYSERWMRLQNISHKLMVMISRIDKDYIIELDSDVYQRQH